MVECEKCGLQVVSPPFESQSGTLTLFFEELAKFSLPELPLALSAELLSGDEVALAEFMAFIKIKREYSQD
jgi:hypothetical protein